MKRIVLVLVSMLPLSVLSLPDAAAQDIQSLESISQTVKAFIYSSKANSESLTVNVKALDKRLRLSNCGAPLEATWPNRSGKLGRVTVQIACPTPKPWRVYVQATVTMKGMVWTLARGVRRDDILSTDVLVRREVILGANNAALSSLGTPIVDIEPWLGFSFTQGVNAGKVLNERMLKPANLLNKGDAVVIRHRSKGLELQTRGIALTDAGERQQTQVRNSSSGKLIDVVVVAPGIVEILQ